MPIIRNKDGSYSWGSTSNGKFKTKKQARQQEKAAYANGYKGTK